MELDNLSKLIATLTIAILPLFSADKLLATEKVYSIIGLAPDNILVRFDTDSRKSNSPISVKGLGGDDLQCIDFRPANGKLYGLTDADKIYTIDIKTGAATFVSTLNISFNGGFQSGCDFNPVVDRLRVVGSNDQNFRINVDTGAVATLPGAPANTSDTPLAYATGDVNAGVDPNITGAAYTNSFAGPPSPVGVTPPTRTTVLYGIDYDLNVLVIQNPPNAGTLNTVGSLGVNFDPIGGFDIFSPSAGNNVAFALSSSDLYTINLATGAAKKLGDLSRSGFIGLAVTIKNKD